MQARLLSAAILATLSFSASAFAVKADSPAALRAKGMIDGSGAAAIQRADADSFTVKNVIVDRDGSEHVRFERSYRGLPVIGGDFVVHSKNGRFKSASVAMKSKGRPDVTATIDKDTAIIEAGSRFQGTIDSLPTADLVVFARNTTPTLAYRVTVNGVRSNDQAYGAMVYYVDAKTGALLQEDDQVRTGKPGGSTGGGTAATGLGKTLTLGNVTINTASSGGSFNMTDMTRGGGSTWDVGNSTMLSRSSLFTDADNTWGNNTNADRASAAADAHYGVAATWDYYKNTFGRNGIFNDGKGAKSYVHYGRNYVNAYWSGSYMVYGDGDGVNYRPLVALDVAGHEMTHGVTQAVNGLGYYNIKDSGGLNEASSDIMGTMVEFSVNNANDPGDYLIGEEIYISNPNGTRALRRMFDQASDGYSINCYPVGGFTASLTGKGGQYDPHNTSGVGNRFFYLLAEGAVNPAGFNYTASQLVCNGDTGVAGIGRTKAAAIWYRAMDVYFVSTTDYPGARAATLSAAADLYGNGSAEYAAVARAWDAVLVN